jgi:mRNA interferase MazF
MKRGDIVLVNLPQPAINKGHEQVGNRPALVIHNDTTSKTLSVISIIPFTSNLNAQQYPHTILVQPSSTNGLSAPSVLLVFQLRAIDKHRIIKKLGHLESTTMNLVDVELKILLSL